MPAAIWAIITGAIPLLWAGLKKIAPELVIKILSAIGLTMATNKYVLPEMQSYISHYATGMTAEASNFLGAIGLGQAISMVLSAYTVSATTRVFLSKKST